jgi:hypothetical protein
VRQYALLGARCFIAHGPWPVSPAAHGRRSPHTLRDGRGMTVLRNSDVCLGDAAPNATEPMTEELESASLLPQAAAHSNDSPYGNPGAPLLAYRDHDNSSYHHAQISQFSPRHDLNDT